MKWGALFGWGIVIYAVAYLAWSLLVIHGMPIGWAQTLLLYATIAITVVAAARSLHLSRWYDVLPYSIGWLIVIVFFDALCAVPVSGWGIWSDWHIWVGYLFVVLLPLVVSSAPAHNRRS